MKIITANSVNVSRDLAHAKKMDVNVYLQKSVLKYSIHFDLAYACAFWNAIRSYKKSDEEHKVLHHLDAV